MDSIDDLSFVLDVNDREKLYIAILTAQDIGVIECFASDNVVVCDDNTIAVDDQTDFDTKININGVKINDEFLQTFYQINADLFEIPDDKRKKVDESMKLDYKYLLENYSDLFESNCTLQAHINNISNKCNSTSCMETGWICDNLRYLAINGFKKYKKFKYTGFDDYVNAYTSRTLKI